MLLSQKEKIPNWKIEENEYDRKLKFIFDSTRNLLTVCVIFATGSYSLKNFGGVFGYPIFLFGGFLLAALLGQWSRKTARENFSRWSTYAIVSLLYLCVLLVALFITFALMKEKI